MLEKGSVCPIGIKENSVLIFLVHYILQTEYVLLITKLISAHGVV